MYRCDSDKCKGKYFDDLVSVDRGCLCCTVDVCPDCGSLAYITNEDTIASIKRGIADAEAGRVLSIDLDQFP